MTSPPLWRLDDILDRKDIPHILAELDARVDRLVRRRKTFTATMPARTCTSFMDELERIERAISKLSSYANNWYSENTRNQKAASLRQRIKSAVASVETRLLFVNQEWKRFDAKNAARLIRACPQYAFHLSEARKRRKHMLSEEQETIITLKDINGVGALPTIYNIITTGFTYRVRGKDLRFEDVLKAIRDPDAKLRFEAYESLLARYAEHKEVLGELYMHIVDDWRREAELRKYPSSISVRNMMNSLPDEAVDALLRVCERNFSVFQHFFRKKAKLLGMKRLRRCDIYAPIAKTTPRVSWDEAVRTVRAVFTDFHPAFAEAAAKIIDGQHIHARSLPHKQTGAYCSYPSTDTIPYVMLSYNDTMLSMGTLIHELGHGIHGVLASGQNQFNHHAPIPICETASIFSEVLLSERLRKEHPKLAKDLAVLDIDDFYASIARQAGFVLFEQKAHEMVKTHASVDQLSAEYLKQLRRQFGNAVEVPDSFRYEWLYVPHIYNSPFYCYGYAFGNLLSLAFYAQYKKDPAFAEKIVAFLAKGGSEAPRKMVRAAGFDLADENFWQSGFDVIDEMVKRI